MSEKRRSHVEKLPRLIINGAIEPMEDITKESKVNCYKCKAKQSSYWRHANDGDYICSKCYGKISSSSSVEKASSKQKVKQKSKGSSNKMEAHCSTSRDAPTSDKEMDVDEETPLEKIKSPPRVRNVRNTTRAKTVKSKKFTSKGRRHAVFKKNQPVRISPAEPSFVTSKYVFHKGSYLQSGDIVVMKGQDNLIYYAQVNLFLIDQVGEKTVGLTWLLPTEESPTDGNFDARTYIIGPTEEYPRSLDGLHFLCHAPTEYYHTRSRRLQTFDLTKWKGYLITSMGLKPYRHNFGDASNNAEPDVSE